MGVQKVSTAVALEWPSVLKVYCPSPRYIAFIFGSLVGSTLLSGLLITPALLVHFLWFKPHPTEHRRYVKDNLEAWLFWIAANLTISWYLALCIDIFPIIVRFLNSDNTLGTVQQEITSYTISPDGLRITLKPSANLPAGQNFIFEFPGTCSQGPCIYPGQPATQPLYIGFNSSQLIGPVLAGSFPVLAVVLGVVVVGLGVAAASGAFSNGGGGNNPSSQ